MKQEYLLNIQNELLELAARGNGLKSLTNRFSELTQKQIVITNASFFVLACSQDCPYKEKEFLTFILENAELGTGNLQGENEKTHCLMISIKHAKETLGFMFILQPGEKIADLLELGKGAGLVFALELNKLNELIKLERSYRDLFIFDLLYGNIESNEEIITRGEILGWNMRRPHGVIVFEIDNYEHFSEDKHFAVLLYEIISSVLHEQNQQGILIQKKGEVVLILPMTKETKREQRAFMKFLIGKVKALHEKKLNERTVRVGVGRNYDSPNEIFRSYQEAKVALELGSLMHSQESTPFFVEMGLARILYNHDKQELMEFYRETLGDLERYDKTQGGELMETLEKYLMYKCDLKATADAIFLHPNTLRYRLKKIEEILGVKLTDVDAKLNVAAALKIKYLKKF